MVQVESEGYNQQTITVPFCSLKGGVDNKLYIDLLLPHPSKIKLVCGEGPISLVDSLGVEFFNYRDMGGDEEYMEDEDMEDEEEEGAESSKDDEVHLEEQETVQLVNEDKGEDKPGKKGKAKKAAGKEATTVREEKADKKGEKADRKGEKEAKKRKASGDAADKSAEESNSEPPKKAKKKSYSLGAPTCIGPSGHSGTTHM